MSQSTYYLAFGIWSIAICFVFVTGIILLIRNIKIKSKKLWFLAAYNLVVPLSFITILLSTEKLNPPILTVFLYIAFVLLFIFTKVTFYEGKVKVFAIILIVSIILFIIWFTTSSISYISYNVYIDFLAYVMFAVEMSLSTYWFGYNSLKQYHLLKHQYIKPWLKKRFLIGGISSIAFGLIGIASFIQFISELYPKSIYPVENGLFYLLFQIIAVILILVFTFGSFIAWVMPNKIKQYFNRGFRPEEELSEDDLMKLLEER